jgi:hypothetical protein
VTSEQNTNVDIWERVFQVQKITSAKPWKLAGSTAKALRSEKSDNQLGQLKGCRILLSLGTAIGRFESEE